MAYFEKLESGRWRAQIRRKKLPSVSKSFATKREAQGWAAEYEHDIRSGRVQVSGGVSVGYVFERYCEEVTKGWGENAFARPVSAQNGVVGEVSSKAKKGHRSEQVRIAKMLRDNAFMELDIAELSHLHLRQWVLDRTTGPNKVSDSSARRELGVIGAVLNHARDRWDMPVQPDIMKKVQKPPEHPSRKRNVSRGEVGKIWAACPGPIGSSITSYIPVLFEFCCETAMRKGEALALTRKDIYVDGELMWAQLHTSKNGEGRAVPFTARAKELFAMLPIKVTVPHLGKLNGPQKVPPETETQFAQRQKDESLFPVKSATLDTMFRRLLREIGISDLHFHDSRHQATLMLSRRLSVIELAKVTGHKTTNVLLNVYYQPSGADLAQRLAQSFAAEQSTH